MKVANQKGRSLLASNAYHHRVDSLTALVALVSICSSHFFTNAAWLDPVGGLVISAMIIQAGWGNTLSALLELADVGIEGEFKTKIETAAKTALESAVTKTQGATLVGVQGIKSGQNYLIDIAISAPSTWTLSRMKTVEDAVRQNVTSQVRGVKKVSVRFVDEQTSENAFSDELVAFDSDAEEDQKQITKQKVK